MTPLERAAMALCELLGIDPEKMVHGIVEGEKRPIWMAEQFTEQVRAVLLAIREPSEGMVDAGRWPAEDDGPVACWTAMIDKALEEG